MSSVGNTFHLPFELVLVLWKELGTHCYHHHLLLLFILLQTVSKFVDISEQIKEVLALDEQIHGFAEELYQQKSLLIMGRGHNYATCLEGALVSIGCVSSHFFIHMLLHCASISLTSSHSTVI